MRRFMGDPSLALVDLSEFQRTLLVILHVLTLWLTRNLTVQDNQRHDDDLKRIRIRVEI